jgi:hypothetical protein
MAERNEKGQFAPGTTGGPGRPNRAAEMDYVAAVRVGVPPRVVVKVLKVLVDLALGGDVKACLALLKVTCGADAPAVLELGEKLRQLEEDMGAKEEATPPPARPRHRPGAQAWQPRSLAAENDSDTRNGHSGHADGSGGVDDPGTDPDGYRLF